MISISKVAYGYEKDSIVVRNLDFAIDKGRIYGLLGKNGSGKTTLLKLLCGEIFPKKGKITADGRDAAERETETLGNIFFIPAEFGFGHLSLDKFIRLHSPFYSSFETTILNDCLEAFGMDKNIRDMEKLSFGQKRKVLFSFALAVRTTYLLMDEPFEGMDIPSRDVFRKMLIRHLTENQTAVISTHTVSDIENLLSDVIILKTDGSAFTCSTAELARKYAFSEDFSTEGAVYFEPCAGGYRTIRPNIYDEESSLDLEMLFNAVTKGVIK